jgi:BolA protein
MSNQERIIQERIVQKLADAVDLQHLEVVNESGNHNVPAGSESHFKVVLVSETFAAMPLIARHRQVNGILSDVLANDIHALAIHTYTGKEWRKKNGEAPMSPPCLGGSR